MDVFNLFFVSFAFLNVIFQHLCLYIYLLFSNEDYINSILLETSYNEVPKRCVSILTKYDEQNNILLAFIDKDSVSIYIKSKSIYLKIYVNKFGEMMVLEEFIL